MDKPQNNKGDIIFNLSHNKTNMFNLKFILINNPNPIWTQTYLLDSQPINPNMETIPKDLHICMIII